MVSNTLSSVADCEAASMPIVIASSDNTILKAYSDLSDLPLFWSMEWPCSLDGEDFATWGHGLNVDSDCFIFANQTDKDDNSINTEPSMFIE